MTVHTEIRPTYIARLIELYTFDNSITSKCINTLIQIQKVVTKNLIEISMDTETMTGLANRIERICQEKGLTYNKLAKRLDMSSTTFYQLTSGRTKQLSIEVLIKFHQILGINIEWLVTGDGSMYSMNEVTELVEPPAEGREMGRVAQGIEDIKRYFEEEIKIKNQQIAGLQRTVDALVGKSEGATDNPLSFDEFKLKVMYHYYTQAAYRNVIAPSVHAFRLATHD